MKNIKWGILRMAGGVVSATIAIYGAWLTGRVIEIAMSGDKSQFWSYLIVLIIATVVRSVVSYLNPNASQRYGFLNGKTFRKLTLEKITRLPINYYENKHTGDTISKFIVDIERLQWFSTNAMASIWSYVPTLLIISTIYLVKLNALLMLICCACIPLISYIIGKISIPISDTSKIIQTKKSEYNSYLRDFLEGIHIYKAFNMKKQFAPKFEDACEDVAQESYKIARKKSYGLSLNVLNTLVPQILTYAIGLTFVIRKLLTVGELVIFANMLALFLNAFQQITNNWQDILVKEGLARHFFELLDEDEERTDGEDYTEAQSEIAIEFRNVSFKYNESQHVLKDISFTIEKGEKVALVGMSGSGKTTIHKLICGFYEDYEGEIRVNGKNIRDWNYESLRKNLSIVTQDVFLFDSTIKENIRYGRVGASDEEIVIGAKMAYAHDFIEELESGYETKAGERGGSLSGGQKQRIAIARAILDNAPILLLDEPTSALDTKSEHYINLALEQLEEGKTSLVIAHRLSTIETAQKIIVIEDGYVVETGTHQELIKNQSRYSDLYQRQIQTDKREGQNEK